MRTTPLPAGIRRQLAFTLLEVLLACTLSVLLLGMLFNVLAGVLDSWNATSTREETYREVRAALQIMNRDLGGMVKARPDASALTTDITVKSDPNAAGKVMGFLCKVPVAGQPAGQGSSDVGAVVYFLSPSPSSPASAPALFRRLIPSNLTYIRLQSPGLLFAEACDPGQPGTEMVAQNVTHFKITLRDQAFKPLSIPPAAGQAPAAQVEVELEAIGSRPAQEYFDPSTSIVRKEQLRLREARKFSLRHRL